jgi:hypothetical protein
MAKKLSSWNMFVKKVYKENPGKTFGQCLKIASTLKKQGKMNGNAMTAKSTKKRKSRKSRR